MIDPNFQPPEARISKEETARRMNLLPWIKEYFNKTTHGIIVAGSLSYGADYSVGPNSDIDVQLVLDDAAMNDLELLDLFDKADIEYAVSGYRRGIYQQFSLNGEKDGVSIECHFWGKQAFIDAVSYVTDKTPRLRSSIAAPSTDYGFSFDGSHDAIDFFGEIIDGYPVSVLPSYRIVNSKIYLCRPITNILGGPILLKTDTDIDVAIQRCWLVTIDHLKSVGVGVEDDGGLSVVNALPSQYKMSPESKAAVNTKAEQLLFS